MKGKNVRKIWIKPEMKILSFNKTYGGAEIAPSETDFNSAQS